MKLFIIEIGAPGSGKGTLQTHGFSKVLRNYYYFSTGEEMRAERERKTHLGKQFDVYHDRGIMVPDALTLQLVVGEFEKANGNKVIVSDGFPRTVSQMVPAFKLVKGQGFERILIVNIDTPKETCLERIVQAKRGRDDDGDLEKAEIRYSIFMDETLPVLREMISSSLDSGCDHITIDGTHMKQDAQRYARGIASLYGLETVA